MSVPAANAITNRMAIQRKYLIIVSSFFITNTSELICFTPHPPLPLKEGGRGDVTLFITCAHLAVFMSGMFAASS